MSLGKPGDGRRGSASYKFDGLSRSLTPSPQDQDTADKIKKHGLGGDRFPSHEKTLVGMPAVSPPTPVPPSDVRRTVSSTSQSALAAIDPDAVKSLADIVDLSKAAPAAANNTPPVATPESVAPTARAVDLFTTLVSARVQIAHICDDPEDVASFEYLLREYGKDSVRGDAFMRELAYWLNNRVIRVKFFTDGKIEDGWALEQPIDEKTGDGKSYRILVAHSMNVGIKKVDSSDPLTTIGTKRIIHLRRILPHNMHIRG